MKRILLIALLAASGHVYAAPVFKCVTADGRTIFSNAGCGTEHGRAEIPEIKINQMGTIAGQEDVQRLRRAREAEKYRQNSLTIIKQTTDDKSREAHTKRRLDAYEEAIDRATPPDPSGVDVIKSHQGETNRERARRLDTQVRELGY